MPELRKDPIVGRWVIYAPDRAKRPVELHTPLRQEANGYCPFCVGNESATPDEILAYRDPGAEANGEGWRVRVIPNKYPALQVEGTLEKRGEGIYDMMNGVGAHEVIIESAHHERNMSRLSVENINEVLWAYHDRLVDLKRDPRLVHALIFKNKGAGGGASLDHAHSQLIVTPTIPINIWEELTGAQEFYKFRGRCIYCDMIQQELAHGERVVLDTPNFLVIAPYASRFPFETWILPKHHSSHFENISRQTIEEMGLVLKTALAKLEIALDDPPYNYVIHSSPFDSGELPHYHWHMEIIPRVTQIAGFEWGSGCHINTVHPEEAAAFLQNVEVDAMHGVE